MPTYNDLKIASDNLYEFILALPESELKQEALVRLEVAVAFAIAAIERRTKVRGGLN